MLVAITGSNLPAIDRGYLRRPSYPHLIGVSIRPHPVGRGIQNFARIWELCLPLPGPKSNPPSFLRPVAPRRQIQNHPTATARTLTCARDHGHFAHYTMSGPSMSLNFDWP